MTRWADFMWLTLSPMMPLPQVQICMLSSSPRNTGPDHLEVARYPWSWLAWLFKLQYVTLHTLMIFKLIQPLFVKPEKTRKPVRIRENVTFGSKMIKTRHDQWKKVIQLVCLFVPAQCDIEVKAQQLHKACQNAPSTDVWTKPGEGITSTVLDHAEEALRRCFGKTKEGPGLHKIWPTPDREIGWERKRMGNTCPLHMFLCGIYKFYCSGFLRALFGLGPRIADVVHATRIWIRPALCKQSVAGSQCHF